MPSPEIVPVHDNIFNVPQNIDDGYRRVDTVFATNMAKYALFGSVSKLGHTGYTRAIVGSEWLATFYSRLEQAIEHVSQFRKPQPVAVTSGKSIVIGHALKHRVQASPRLLNVSSEASILGDSVSFVLNLALADSTGNRSYIEATPKTTFFSDPEGDELVIRQMNAESGQVISCPIEANRWWEGTGTTSGVQREVVMPTIAVGREAVELLPILHNSEVANAYDRLLGSAVQEI